MMSARPDGPHPVRPKPRTYEVVCREGRWCVCVNGCATGPLPRREAVRLARRLQSQADRLV